MVFALAGNSTTTSFTDIPSRIRVRWGRRIRLVKRLAATDLAAGVAVEPAGEVELEQRHLHRARSARPTGG